ncbi:uncharacterized protein [Leptinotarsa decemlineata]|uniref:uncharacterized protein n=1 Tax=Leptinotarsa decemlineata TaxID=7539 RepID=UPI003D30A0AF
MPRRRRSYTIRDDCIPELDPENENLSAGKWLDKIEQLKEVNIWDDVTTIYHMQSRLWGMARSWYHSLSNYTRCWRNYKALIMTFADHMDYALVWRKMLNGIKRPDETMTNYYITNIELLRTCQISGRHAVSCFIDGITEVTTRNGARAGRNVIPEALYGEYLSMLRGDKSGNMRSSIRRVPKPELRQLLSSKQRYPFRVNVDSGCVAVTIKMSEFQNLNLHGEPTVVCLRDHGGESVSIRTKVPITLAVDLAVANVEALVGPDNIQNVSMIVGQLYS